MKAIFVLLIFLPLTAMLIFEIYNGLKTGKIRHSDSTSYFSRKTQPVHFWFVVCLFSLFVAGGMYILCTAFIPDSTLPN